MKNKNSIYLILTILLVILSTIGGYFLFKMYQNSNLVTYTSSTVPKIELLPTDSIEQPIQIATPSTSTSTITPTIIPSVTIAVATATATPKLTKLISTLIPTKPPVITKNIIPYQNKEDNFSVDYSSKRKLYLKVESNLYDDNGDKEQSVSTNGNLYTFQLDSGSFAIHVTPSDFWSWKNPDRSFDSIFLVSGKPTFVHKIETQTIIDLQSDEKNYTIQCAHNGIESLKTECDQFISSFKLL